MSADASGTVTYRGRSLEEVLPKIREELGPDAVIERQRTGLVGGVGGFFQREMIEVDARPAAPGEHGTFDVLAGADDDSDLRAATAPPPDPDRDEGLSAPAMRRMSCSRVRTTSAPRVGAESRPSRKPWMAMAGTRCRTPSSTQASRWRSSACTPPGPSRPTRCSVPPLWRSPVQRSTSGLSW